MLIMHLFVSYAHANLCHFVSSPWCRGFAAASACGASWTFLFTFFQLELFCVRSCQNQKSKGMPQSVSDGGEYAIAMVVSL